MWTWKNQSLFKMVTSFECTQGISKLYLEKVENKQCKIIYTFLIKRNTI